MELALLSIPRERMSLVSLASCPQAPHLPPSPQPCPRPPHLVPKPCRSSGARSWWGVPFRIPPQLTACTPSCPPASQAAGTHGLPQAGDRASSRACCPPDQPLAGRGACTARLSPWPSAPSPACPPPVPLSRSRDTSPPRVVASAKGNLLGKPKQRTKIGEISESAQ